MFELTIIIFCILLNGILAGSEIAFIATDKFVLKGLANSGSKEGALLLSLRQNPERVLSIIQVGITFVSAFAAAIGGAGAQETLSPWLSETFALSQNTAEIFSTLLIVIPLTYFSVVFGELIPKSIALKKPLFISTKVVYLFILANYLFFPIIWIFEYSTKNITKLFFRSKESKTSFLTDDIVSEQGQEYIINMLKIEKSTINDALIKWDLVDFILHSDTLANIEKKFIISGHTRLPVVKNEKAIGVLNSKEFFAFQKTGGHNWQVLMRKPIHLQKNTFILKALKALQQESAHMAIVSNENTLLGIITMEDIFEEIVGDIYDEDDYGSIKKILGKTKL